MVKVNKRPDKSHTRIFFLAEGCTRALMHKAPFSIPRKPFAPDFPALIIGYLESAATLDRIHR